LFPRDSIDCVDILERHYSLQDLADHWRVSTTTIHRLFLREAGIVHIFSMLRIPHSVAERVYRQAGQAAADGRIRRQKFKARHDRKTGRVILEPRVMPSLAHPPRVVPPEGPERYFTLRELAAAWHVSTDSIRRRFRYEPGVLQIRRSTRIPETVAMRVYKESMQSDGTVRAAARRADGPVSLPPLCVPARNLQRREKRSTDND
jgi:hypothetical protein